MKRHPSLRKFSDDHHGGLVQARRLRLAAAEEGESPREAARAFLRFWREDTSLHFREDPSCRCLHSTFMVFLFTLTLPSRVP
jgi:hypothetical protein